MGTCMSLFSQIPPKRKIVVLSILLAVLTLAAYLPVWDNTYIWDDDDYVLANAQLRTWDGLVRIWTEPGSIPQYYPLLHSMFWLEYQLWGEEPLGYHLVNVLFHLCNAFLVWTLLRKLNIPGAWLAAAVFAVHPLQVETVAWITERKNILLMLFALSAALALIRSVSVRENGTEIRVKRKGWYGTGLLFFLLALLSKTVAAMMPVMLGAGLWWRYSLNPQGVKRICAILAPFLMLGLGMGLMTVLLEVRHVGATGDPWQYGFIERCLIAGRALWFYLGKLAWPDPLIFFYQRWVISQTSWWQYLYPVSFLGMSLALWWGRRYWGRGPLAAVAAYSAALFPALGFFNVYPHQFSFVADHFAYMATVPIIALGTAAVMTGWERLESGKLIGHTGEEWIRFLRLVAPACCLVVLASLTILRLPAFHDPFSLWEDTLAKNPASWAAHHNLAFLLKRSGDWNRAWHHFRAAEELNPGNSRVYWQMAEMLEASGDMVEAKRYYEEAVRLGNNNPSILLSAGNFFVRREQYDRAAYCYLRTLELDPVNFSACLNMGSIHMLRGQPAEAEACYRRALAASPDNNLAREYLQRAVAAQNNRP